MSSKIVVALDFPDKRALLDFKKQLEPKICRVKIGLELFSHYGPNLVKDWIDDGFDVFLDLKFHDIPSTVAKACYQVANLGVWMTNVHACGGSQMLQDAKKAILDSNHPDTLLIGVSVLTSMQQTDLHEINVNKEIVEQVHDLAQLSKQAGLDGLVCSAQEASHLKKHLGQEFKLVTPGIRLNTSDVHDQKRVVTPLDAINMGSDYLVMGRAITQHDNPNELINTLNQQIASR